MDSVTTPTPIEDHDGIAVKREDLVDPVVRNGKMRGVLPYARQLRAFCQLYGISVVT